MKSEEPLKSDEPDCVGQALFRAAYLVGIAYVGSVTAISYQTIPLNACAVRSLKRYAAPDP